MIDSQNINEHNKNFHSSNTIPRSKSSFIQDKKDFFSFLKSKESPSRPRPFFSENGLSQDIIKVTNAEPDICLEVFYALFNVLPPQFEKLNGRKKLGVEENRLITSLQDAWTNFIGVPGLRGVLWSPEKLMDDAQDIEVNFQKNEGEKYVFRHLDSVIELISSLKTKLGNYPGEILQRKEIMASLDLVQEFYLGFRNKVKDLVMMILEDRELKKNYQALHNLLEHKAVMMSDIFPHHWAYRIPRRTAQKVLSLDRSGDPLKNYSDEGSTHRVAALPERNEAPEPLVYFKANGGTHIQPEKEFILYSLYRQLQIPVPETALLILTNVNEDHPDYYYAAQASEAVVGESALKACQGRETIFEKEAYVFQVIGTLLTNPSDGSFKNFKYSSLYKTLVGIDNDLIFKPELNEYNNKTVNVKSILYLLSLMKDPVPEAIRTLFTTIDSHLLISIWLRDFQKKNKEYELLFTRLSYQRTRYKYQTFNGTEKPPLPTWVQEKVQVDSKPHEEKLFYPQILISKNLLKGLTAKLLTIKTVLENNPSTSPQILFEAISPILSIYYQRLRERFQDCEVALYSVWGERVNDRFYSSIETFLNPEELSKPTRKESISNDEMKNLQPEDIFEEYKIALTSDPKQTPLDKFIKHHSERKMNGLLLDFHQILKELELLVQEGLTHSKSLRDIVDFWYDLSEISQSDKTAKELQLLLFKLPDPELKWLFTIEKHFLRPEDPASKSIPLSVNGAFMKKRNFNLTEFEKYLIFDHQGNIRKNASLSGRSRVNYFPAKNPEFYLKQYPEFPGYEYASILFMRLLGVTQLPYQDLLIINSKYPVFLTEAVDGDPVFKVWDNPQAFEDLDPFHTGLLIIAAMLFNPEDGKEDNYILSKDGKYLIPIDNDHCFLPSTFQQGKFWDFIVNTALQTKTILFSLEQMKKPVPEEVKKHILGIKFDELLQSWLQELIKVDEKYHNLVEDEKQRDAFLQNGTVLRIHFYEQFIQHLYWKANKIQDLLKSPSEQTSLSLLKAVEPFAGRCYEDTFKSGRTLQSRFHAVTSQLYGKTQIDGSRMSILNTKIMMNVLKISKKGLQNDSRFNTIWPQKALEGLKGIIQDWSQNRRMEQDLLCELDETNQEKKLWNLFGNPQVETALKDFFINPKEGLILKGSKLIISSELRDLFALAPDQGKNIKFLSLPYSPLLTRRTVKTLIEGCPNIEYLNLNGCVKLEEIVIMKGEWPLLTRLEARECLNLKAIISYSPIKILRIGTYRQIKIVVEKCFLEILAISTKRNDFDFWLEKGDNFQIIPLRKATSLLQSALLEEEKFDKYFRNPIIRIGAHSILSVKDLGIFITSIDLQNLDLRNFEIVKLAQLNLFNLETLKLPTLKLAGTKILEDLIQGVWPKLRYLDFSKSEIGDEGLEILAQGNWPLLEEVNISKERVSKKGWLKFILNTDFPNLKRLNWYYRSLSVFRDDFPNCLLPKNWDLLENLDLSSAQITQNEIQGIVDKFKWPNLESLNLSYNPGIDDNGLAVLSQAHWPALKTLNLKYTRVTKKGLIRFILNRSRFSLKGMSLLSDFEDLEIVFSEMQWNLLKILDLSSSELTEKEIETIVEKFKWPNLKSLNLSHNPSIKAEGLQILAYGDWSKLEILNLSFTGVTIQELLDFILRKEYSNLKEIIFASKTKDEKQKFIQQNWYMPTKLDLRFHQITQLEIGMIIKCPWLQLEHLILSENSEIKDEGVQILAQGNWPLLEILDLGNIKVTPVGIKAIVSESNWPQLKHLILSQNSEIKDEGVQILAQGNWPLLETLDIGNINMTSMGIQGIAELSHWAQLKHLDLSYNQKIQEDGLQILTRGNWPFLETLNVSFTKITKKGLLTFLYNANWPNLREITLPKCWDNASKSLALNFIRKDSSRVERLELTNLNVLDAGIETIVKHQWPILQYLNVSDNDISFEGFSTLALADCPLLEDLHLKNTKLSPESIEAIVKKSKWQQLKFLDISDNEVFDDGLSAIALGNWPLLKELHLKNTGITHQGLKTLANQMNLLNLKKLDISRNAVLDEGLKMLALGDWPSLQHLVYYETQVTPNGSNALLGNSKWPNLHELEHSLHESFFNYDENLEEWLPPEVVRTIIPINYQTRPLWVIVLKMSWQKSRDIYLTTLHNGCHEKIMLLTPEEWDKLESLQFSFEASPKINSIQPIDWPTNLRKLQVLNNPFFDDKKLKTFFLHSCPLLEDLSLKKIGITTKGIEILIAQSSWAYLKKLDLSGNPIQNEGVGIFVSAKWPVLDDLNLADTEITAEGIKTLVSKSEWPNLKKLDVSGNLIEKEGIEFLSRGKWDRLEHLILRRARITAEGIRALSNKLDWPCLRKLDVSDNQIGNEGLKLLSSGKWPDLEHLYLLKTDISDKGVEILASLSKWPNLKALDLSWNKQFFDEGFGIMASRKWPLLESLSLNYTNMKSSDVEILVNKSSWSNLKEISLTGHYERDAMKIIISRKWPNIKMAIDR